MMEPEVPERSGSLARRVYDLEMKIMSRHQKMHSVVAGCKRKITDWMVSPVTLLEAFGIGVAMERTSHRREWSLASIVGAAGASIRLLLSLSTPAQPVSENPIQEFTREHTRG